MVRAISCTAAATLCLILLSGCGWQLRGYHSAKTLGKERIPRVALSAAADNRLFLAILQRQLDDIGIAQDSAASIKLNIAREHTERRPLSYSSTGIPVQYQLIMTVSFTVIKNSQSQPVEKRFLARRQYDFDTELVVAKNEEEKQLRNEMREELAAKIIAQLHE